MWLFGTLLLGMLHNLPAVTAAELHQYRYNQASIGTYQIDMQHDQLQCVNAL